MGQAPARDAVLTAYAQSLIRFKARQLARKPGFSRSDEDDLAQEMTAYLLGRAGRFDPERASLRTFVDRVVNSSAATILRNRRRRKRAAGFSAQSLETEIEGSDGVAVSLRQLLSDADLERRTGAHSRDAVLQKETAADVQRVMGGMPPRLRDIARRLMTGTPTAVARNLGISRWQIRKAIEQIRTYFEDAGLGDF